MRIKRHLIALCGVLLATLAGILPASADAPKPGAPQPIIGGGFASQGPWAVAIMVNGQQNCSGTIVAARYVLTARHCANAGNTFLIGSTDRNAGQVRRPIRAIAHPSADIILYELNSPVTTTYAVLTTTQPSVGSTEQVYGFGRTESARDSRYLKVASMRITRVSSAYIDATRINGYTGPGDSGGPVFQNGRLIGVHSYGDTSAGTSGHVNVLTYRQWILSNSGQLATAAAA
ncbi:trypsin-like serine protease [Streptomyces sp. DSM 44917]|uniref:Trypsin-like serine protease n=1 Tax=Streptomyces boetiae TaxID=3075541 RepID=A0ABU2L4C1_9ACTN|nr:trypsin-like serine protease [Streptomyces sp. DSM 44917]MDT0306409.1 trypsin-like serine protease [Streptomyces sp. DSM 44917]